MAKNTHSRRKVITQRQSVNKVLTQRSSSRIRKRISRYGSRSSSVNGDEFFEQLINREPDPTNAIIEITSESSSSNQTNDSHDTNNLSSVVTPLSTSPIAESTPSNPNHTFVSNVSHSMHSALSVGGNTFEEIVLKKLDEILVRLGELEKNTAKTDVRLRNVSNELVAFRQNPRAAATIGSVDPADLAKRGLPINSLEALDSFERNLKDEAFVNDIVSLIMSVCNIIRISQWFVHGIYRLKLWKALAVFLVKRTEQKWLSLSCTR